MGRWTLSVWAARLPPTLILACATAFTPPGVTAQDRRHPVPEYRVREAGPVQRLDLTSTPTARRVLFGAPTGGLGQLDSPDAEVFGNIIDVEISAAGFIYLLDGMSRNLRVFTGRLDHLQTVGREGPGPGEFRHPKAVVMRAAGELWVVDFDGRVHVYTVLTSGMLEFQRTFALRNTHVEGACAVRGNVFVLGFTIDPSDPFVVRKISPSGAEVAAFGRFYDSGSSHVDKWVGIGRITCVEAAELIVVSPAPQLAEIRGYGPDGETRWTTDIIGLAAPVLTTPGGRVRVQVPDDGRYAAVDALTPARDGTVTVSIAWRRRGEEARMQYARLNARDGSGRVLGWGSPRIAAYTGQGRPVGVDSDPFPRMVIFEPGSDDGGR